MNIEIVDPSVGQLGCGGGGGGHGMGSCDPLTAMNGCPAPSQPNNDLAHVEPGIDICGGSNWFKGYFGDIKYEVWDWHEHEDKFAVGGYIESATSTFADATSDTK